MKCNCGKELKLPAIYLGRNSKGIPMTQHKCTCGHVHEVLLDTLSSFKSERSGNVNLSRGEYFKYKNGKIKFSCPLCKRNQFIKDPKVNTEEEETTLNVTCQNGCGFKTDIILEDYK